MPPVSPMLAKSVPTIPDVGHYEPKWDGFRTIVFKDGDEIILGSRNEKPMTRYFPELVEALRKNLPDKCVIDGEIVLIEGNRLEFEVLQQRIHPADSRVRMLAEKTPASMIAFDILALGDDDLMGRPFSERRAILGACARQGGASRVRHARGHGPGARAGMVRAVGGRRPGRGAVQALGRDAITQQARDVQDQARAHRGLRGGWLPLAQDRESCGVHAVGSL